MEVELSEPRELMFRELCEEFGEDEIMRDVESVVESRITELFDNQEVLREQIEDDTS